MILQCLQVLSDNSHGMAGNPSASRVDIKLLTWIGLDVIDEWVMQPRVCSSKTFLPRGANS